MRTFWLSFAQDGFKGVVITDAESEGQALAFVNANGLNPGGQVAIWECDLKHPDAKPCIEALGKNRLCSEDELKVLGQRKLSELDDTERHEAELASVTVCEKCARGIPHEHN